MINTIHTLVYCAPRANIDELMTIANEIQHYYGPEVAKKAETDPSLINETIRENINLIMPESGRKVDRIITIAKEEGIQFYPSEKSMAVISI